MTSDDAAKGGSGGGENKGTADKSEMPPNEANPGAAATAAAAAAEAPEANGGKDAPSAGAANADVEAGKILEQDGVGKVEFTSSKAEEAKKDLYPAMTKAELMPYATDPFWVRLRWILFALFWVAWLAMLVVSVVIIVVAPKCYRPAPKQWWQKGPVYQVYPMSFKDSNGDGKGDIKGIVEKLDYLSDLGVGSVLVGPIYPQTGGSFNADNLKDIDPVLGDLNDFDDLVTGLHERGLKLIMDFVPGLPNKNPQQIIEELKETLKFWLNKGVDGFRVDADMDMLDLLRELRLVLDEKTAEDYHPRILMTKSKLANDADLIKFYGTNFTEHAGDISHMPMNFALIDDLPDAESVTAQNLDDVVSSYVKSMPNPGAWPNFVLGVAGKRRVATRLGHDLVDVMNMVTMLLPGSPITYSGEEIGMLGGGDVPMQWDASANAGFSSATPWLPVNTDYEKVNVKVQLESEHESHIKIYRALAALREQPSILFGSFDSVANGTVFAYCRVKKGNPGYVVAVNLDEEAVSDIDLTGLPMVPDAGLVEVRSHHDRDDKAKEVERADDEEAVGRELSFKKFSLRPKEGIVVNFVPQK